MAQSLVALLNYQPSVVFFAKDRSSRFIAGNEAMLATKNLHHPSQLLGKTDHDFFAPALATVHIEEDRRVIESGQDIVRQIWFSFDRQGLAHWHESSKVALRGYRDRIFGVAGTRSELRGADEKKRAFGHYYPVINHLEQTFTEPVKIDELAEIAGRTVEVLNREFIDLLGMPPHLFVSSFQIEKARQLLVCTPHRLDVIARQIGFSGDEQLERHFERWNGMGPVEYRQRFKTSGDPIS